MMITTVSCFCVCFDVRMKRTVKKVKKHTHTQKYIQFKNNNNFLRLRKGKGKCVFCFNNHEIYESLKVSLFIWFINLNSHDVCYF